MWLSRVPTFWPAAYPSSSLVVFCIFNLLIITHHSGRFCVILANCFMVSFVKALATRTTVCCAARSHYVYVIFVVGGAWENHNMNYICVCFNFRQTNMGHGMLCCCLGRGCIRGWWQDDKTVEFRASDEARQPGHFIQSVSTQMAVKWFTTEWILYLCIRSESLGSSVVAHQKITFYDTIHTLCAHFSLFLRSNGG